MRLSTPPPPPLDWRPTHTNQSTQPGRSPGTRDFDSLDRAFEDARRLQPAHAQPIHQPHVHPHGIHTANAHSVRPQAVDDSPSRRALVDDRRLAADERRLLLQSADAVRSTEFVRNRFDEIDWVATFLRVGFAPAGLYALLCPRRKGRWKAEEERYALELLRLLAAGTLRLKPGETLRAFVGRKLHSDDLRVLKKLSNCPRFRFARLLAPRQCAAGDDELDADAPDVDEARARLRQLEGDFLRAVQLEALVAVRKYLSDATLRELLSR